MHILQDANALYLCTMDVKQIRRAKLSRIAKEFKQIYVAEKARTAPAYISQILSSSKTPSGKTREVGDELARNIEAGMDYPHGWLDTPPPSDVVPLGPELSWYIQTWGPGLGRQKWEQDGCPGGVAIKASNVQPASISTRTIPLINMVQAGMPREVVDVYEPGDGEEQLDIDAELASELGPGSFALKLDGLSMYNPASPDCFFDGDLVIIDPNVKPMPGDFVAAKLDDSQEATFKKYRSRGNDENGDHKFELVPLNDDYAPILVCSDNPGHIIGTMIEHRKRRRRR